MTIEQMEHEILEMKNQLFVDQKRLSQLELELIQLKQARPVHLQSPELQKSLEPPRSTSVDIEKFLGKYWMGIMASFLIFISIILFAVTVLPYMTDTVKIIVIYAVSMAFITVGLILYKKTLRLFYMILTSCGMGALYISLLLSNVYFKVLEDIPLYLCFFVWATGIAFLSRNSIRTFHIVGNVGIILSILLGVMNCVHSCDSSKLITLTVFFFVTALLYEFFNRRFFITNTICNYIGLFFLISGYHAVDASNLILFTIILSELILHLIYITCKKISPYFIYSILSQLYLFGMLNCLFRKSGLFNQSFNATPLGDYLFYFGIYIISLGSIVLINLLSNRKILSIHTNDKRILELFSMITMMYAILIPYFNSVLSVVLLPCVFLLLSTLQTQKAYTIASVVSSALLFFITNNLICSVLLLLCNVAIIAKYYEYENKFCDRICACAGIIIRLTAVEFIDRIFAYMESPNSDCREVISLSIIVSIDLLLKYRFSHKQRDKAVVQVADISSFLCTIIISYMLQDIAEPILYYCTLLLGCIVFMNNVTKFIKSNSSFKQLYAAFKVTFYVIIVMFSLKAASILFSIALFIATILWILIGFKLKVKTVRLYGLIISIISMAKLILVDIQYSTSLARALGFFACGILALLIYFIYNQIEKSSKS